MYNDERSVYFCKTLIACINSEGYRELEHYERILFTVLTMKDSFLEDRANNAFAFCVKLMDNNHSNYALLDLFTGLIIKFAKRDKIFRGMIYQHKLIDKVNKWLSANSSPPIQSLRSSNAVFKSQKHNNRDSYEELARYADLIKDYNIKRKSELKAMHKKTTDWEDPDPESEDDLYEEEIEVESNVDFVIKGRYQWESATVTQSLGDMIRVVKEANDNDMDVDGQSFGKIDLWINKDDTQLAPHKTKVNSLRARVIQAYNRAYDS